MTSEGKPQPQVQTQVNPESEPQPPQVKQRSSPHPKSKSSQSSPSKLYTQQEEEDREEFLPKTTSSIEPHHSLNANAPSDEDVEALSEPFRRRMSEFVPQYMNRSLKSDSSFSGVRTSLRNSLDIESMDDDSDHNSKPEYRSGPVFVTTASAPAAANAHVRAEMEANSNADTEPAIGQEEFPGTRAEAEFKVRAIEAASGVLEQHSVSVPVKSERGTSENTGSDHTSHSNCDDDDEDDDGDDFDVEFDPKKSPPSNRSSSSRNSIVMRHSTIQRNQDNIQKALIVHQKQQQQKHQHQRQSMHVHESMTNRMENTFARMSLPARSPMPLSLQDTMSEDEDEYHEEQDHEDHDHDHDQDTDELPPRGYRPSLSSASSSRTLPDKFTGRVKHERSRTNSSLSTLGTTTGALEGSSGSDRRTSIGMSSLSKQCRWRERRHSYLNCKTAPYKQNPTIIPTDLFSFNITRMQRLVSEMDTCLTSIQCHAPMEELEKWACAIYESMSAPSRTFHSVQHVFDISIDADPISKLAAFFHDIVYYSIDGGLNDRQKEIIGNVIVAKKDEDGPGEKIYITTETLDVHTKMVMDIFGFKAGQLLDPFKGMNEFLSAALGIRCYEGNLKPVHLAQVAACIEATIPFRKHDADGKSPCDLLFERLQVVNVEYDLGMDEAELVDTVQRSADLGNRDLANFSTPERAVFLSNTWNLLPESNISLRNTKVFRISDYASALKKMTGFFEYLDPNSIYLSFRDDAELQERIHKKTSIAATNVKVATKYMYCKRLSIGVVAAISELSGGDAPLALFLGDLPEPHFVSTSIEDFIDVSAPANGLSIDSCVFNLLRFGRESESKFDIKNSPLAAYLYSLIGDEGVGKCLVYAVHPMDKENARKLLKAIPEFALATIVAACAEIATTREERLNQMMVDLS